MITIDAHTLDKMCEKFTYICCTLMKGQPQEVDTTNVDIIADAREVYGKLSFLQQGCMNISRLTGIAKDITLDRETLEKIDNVLKYLKGRNTFC